jgi:hypothetical protein
MPSLHTKACLDAEPFGELGINPSEPPKENLLL